MKIGKDVVKAARVLKAGGLVAIPTETVYGLAANAFDPQAVVGIYEAKQRPSFNPLIMHTDSLTKLRTWVEELPPLANALAERFWPGPLTLLLPRKTLVPDIVTAGLPRVGVRIPQNPLTLSLLTQLAFPLAAPSANPFGYISPTTAEHVAQQLGEKVDYILDGGPAQVGIESTIVGFESDGSPTLYRLGGIALEAIEAISGPLKRFTLSENPQTSGMLKSHYAPRVALHLGNLEELIAEFGTQNVAILSFREAVKGIERSLQRQLSPSGSLNEAAQNLFASLRELDQLPVQYILAEEVPAQGIGLAINDRLQRARFEHRQKPAEK
ncbi:MAG: L-threonylcarbamoyladenylate synthase [Bacteroidota bacterium]